MVSPVTPEGFETTLSQRPVTWSAVLAVRASLRVLPLVSLEIEWNEERLLAFLHVWRSIFAAWTDVAFPPEGLGWSPERLQALRRLWQANTTASEIADILGGVTRNAVIGKAHRLGLQTRPLGLLGTSKTQVANAFSVSFQKRAAASVLEAASIPPLALKKSQALALGSFRWALETAETSVELFEEVNTGISKTSILRANLALDFEALEQDVKPHELATERLWPGPSLPYLLTPPQGNMNPWRYWVTWYQARLRGGSPGALRREQPLVLEINALPDELWNIGPAQIATEIVRLAHELEYKPEPRIGAEGIDPATLGDVESQNPVALQFVTDAEGRIDVDDAAGAGRLLRDQDAADRHSEVKDAASDLVGLYAPETIGANQVKSLINQVKRFLAAIGAAPSAARPGLVIPRGERLRQTLAADVRSEEVGADPQLPPPFHAALQVLVAAYNVYVALDPELARHDEARLPPEVRIRVISPFAGTALIKDAVASGVATARSDEVLLEEAIVAPAAPSEESRESRRYSESIRNFCRAVATRSLAGIKAAWKHKGKVATAAGTLSAGAAWIATHADQLVRLFPPDSAMVGIIRFIQQFLQG